MMDPSDEIVLLAETRIGDVCRLWKNEFAEHPDTLVTPEDLAAALAQIDEMRLVRSGLRESAMTSLREHLGESVYKILRDLDWRERCRDR